MKQRLILVLENILIVILVIITGVICLGIACMYMLYLCVSIPLDIITLPLVLIFWVISGKWFTFTISKLPLNAFDVIFKRLK